MPAQTRRTTRPTGKSQSARRSLRASNRPLAHRLAQGVQHMHGELLHIAVRARDPDRLGRFYADLFDGDFFVHPVMTGLGIVIVKISHPDAIFRGLLEFWPWDVVWDGA